MKLSLSVRIAETADRKDIAAMPLEELAPIARSVGFEGLSMRASALSVESSSDRVRRARVLLDRLGLATSMVMGNVALAANTPDAPDVLRNIGPHLDLADALGSRLVRIMTQTEDDIPHLRRAADEAAERGLTLAHQTHWGTLCETVDQAIALVRAVDRPNFGITYEPANLRACGGAYGADAVARLAPYLANVYFQNVRFDEAGSHVFETRLCGPMALEYIALDDADGIDVRPLIEALDDAGYEGWFSVHQPLRSGQTVPAAVAEAARVFRPLI